MQTFVRICLVVRIFIRNDSCEALETIFPCLCNSLGGLVAEQKIAIDMNVVFANLYRLWITKLHI